LIYLNPAAAVSWMVRWTREMLRAGDVELPYDAWLEGDADLMIWQKYVRSLP
jgi:hypothetical protein